MNGYPIKLHHQSHRDHVPRAVIDHVLASVRVPHGAHVAYVVTIKLPQRVGSFVHCGLYGPAMGDPPVPESEVYYAARPGRAWPSRLVRRPLRRTHLLTVVAVEQVVGQWVLATVYGGPEAPREFEDPNLTGNAEIEASAGFWSHHALSAEGP